MSNAWRATAYLSLFYFIFGLQLPYLPVWLESARGLNGTQISAVLFGALLARIIVGPLISAWADARTAQMACLILAGGAGLGYLALNITFNPILLSLVGFILMSLVHAIIPLAETSLLLVVGKGRLSFGQGRALASLLFVGGVFLGGALIEHWGAASLVPAITVLFAILTLVAYFTPRVPLGRSDANLSMWQRLKRGFKLYKRPTLFLLLVSASCIQASHAFYYGFSSVIWEKQGFSVSAISFLWVTGIVLEIVFLAMASRLPTWLTPPRLICIGGIAAIIRWTLYGFAPDIISLFVLQNLHALTFAATFIGAIKLVHDEVAKEDQALTLSLLAAVYGAMTGAAGIFSGFLFDNIAMQGYWFMAILSAIGVIFALLMMLRISTRLER